MELHQLARHPFAAFFVEWGPGRERCPDALALPSGVGIVNRIDAFVHPENTVPTPKIQGPNVGAISLEGITPFLQVPRVVVPAGMVTVVYEPQYALNPAKTDYISVLAPGTPKAALPHPMPIAITFFAGQGGEPTLIKIGTAYEAATHHRTPPPAFGPLSGAPGEAAPRRTSVASPNAVAARR